jgi:hypothetical protein
MPTEGTRGIQETPAGPAGAAGGSPVRVEVAKIKRPFFSGAPPIATTDLGGPGGGSARMRRRRRQRLSSQGGASEARKQLHSPALAERGARQRRGGNIGRDLRAIAQHLAT